MYVCIITGSIHPQATHPPICVIYLFLLLHAYHPINQLKYSKILFTTSHTDMIKRVTQGFHGAGGGGGVGNIGGTAEKMVFLSILFVVLSPERATKAATKPAFPASVGSV